MPQIEVSFRCYFVGLFLRQILIRDCSKIETSNDNMLRIQDARDLNWLSILTAKFWFWRGSRKNESRVFGCRMYTKLRNALRDGYETPSSDSSLFGCVRTM